MKTHIIYAWVVSLCLIFGNCDEVLNEDAKSDDKAKTQEVDLEKEITSAFPSAQKLDFTDVPYPTEEEEINQKEPEAATATDTDSTVSVASDADAAADNAASETSSDESAADRLYRDALRHLETGDARFAAHQLAFQLFNAAAKLGHAESRDWVALGTLMGWGVFQSLPRAHEQFSSLAGEGIGRGHFGLAMMHASGLMVNASSPLSLLHLMFGALGGDELAEMALGYRYYAGIGVEEECDKALMFYYRAAKKVYYQVGNRSTFGGPTLSGPTIHRVRLLDEAEKTSLTTGLFASFFNTFGFISFGQDDEIGDPGMSEQLVQYVQFMADKQNVSAQYGLGQLYYHGHNGVGVDLEKAFEYFTKAAEGGSSAAKAYLGEMYLVGNEVVEVDNEKALDLLRESADGNNAIGQTLLGMVYLQGRAGVEANILKAIELFIRAADQGWAEAQLQLGRIFLGAHDLSVDFKLALKYFQMAAQQGNTMALYHLAEMHATGIGMTRSCSTAVELFKNVAERGRWAKWFMFAHTAYWSKRFDEALVTYLVLAELGYEVAQSNAAFMLEEGNYHVIKKDDSHSKAFRHWQRSAAQGSSTSRVKLGDYFYYGLGTNRDFAKAIQHYKLASEILHNAQAMFNLAYMHEQGLGLDRDIHLAKRYYDMASEVSMDAKIPVNIAMTRLSFYFALDHFKTHRLGKLLIHMFAWTASGESTGESAGMDWDYYVIPLLAGLLVALILFMRRGN